MDARIVIPTGTGAASTVPPCLTMVVLGSLVNLSIVTLFLAVGAVFAADGLTSGAPPAASTIGEPNETAEPTADPTTEPTETADPTAAPTADPTADSTADATAEPTQTAEPPATTDPVYVGVPGDIPISASG